MSQNLRQGIQKWLGVLIIAPSIAGLIIAGSTAGIFHLLEWVIFDQFVNLRSAESVDKRIVIVTIGESDIKHVKKWPMSDQVMAKLLRNIKAQQPRGIGIDIYRDLPVEPGHQELVEVFNSIPEAIGVQKVAGEPIAPAPALAELEQVAANDMVLDRDGKIRRGLVIVGNQDGVLMEGLGTKLALMYLKKEGIQLEVIDDQKKIYRLGKAIFTPLTGKEGEYTKDETGGYQILFNYRGELESFPSISMTDVLENRIPPELMRDRIVFIGATAPSLNDLFRTPYTSKLFSASQLTPGVVIHANLTSQILSAALEARPMFRASSKPLNWLWVFFWSGFSAILGAMWLRHRWSVIAIFLAGIIIVITSYWAFLIGWWIPVFTPLLAVAGSAITSIGYLLWTNLKLSYRQLEEYAQTLEQKVEARTAELAQANEEITGLNEKLKAENLRMSAELEVTKQLQQMILPKESELESIEELDIAGFMEPADEVGGDYYDVLQQNGRVKIGIGDVTGHGLASGVLMIMAQTAVRTLQIMNETDPVKFLDVLNRTIYQNVERMNSDKNMTLALLEYSDGCLSLSGQHEEMIVVRVDGTIELIDTIDLGFPIGLDEEIADFIAQEKVKLNPGDLVVLYTDGITEAEDIQGVQYGLERLCEVVKQNWQQSAEEIRQIVIEDVRQHIGEQKVFDDITLLILKRKLNERC
ncbi:MAG: CHASE2 domain-containing protein [Symploca sp. SIO2C1]|nr:CHASE2 domain-containing protein [Symploca sp. SIO2C1]